MQRNLIESKLCVTKVERHSDRTKYHQGKLDYVNNNWKVHPIRGIRYSAWREPLLEKGNFALEQQK